MATERNEESKMSTPQLIIITYYEFYNRFQFTIYCICQ